MRLKTISNQSWKNKWNSWNGLKSSFELHFQYSLIELHQHERLVNILHLHQMQAGAQAGHAHHLQLGTRQQQHLGLLGERAERRNDATMLRTDLSERNEWLICKNEFPHKKEKRMKKGHKFVRTFNLMWNTVRSPLVPQKDSFSIVLIWDEDEANDQNIYVLRSWYLPETFNLRPR